MFGAGVAERLRSMYDSGRRPARGEGGAGSGVPRIAVHIRRGDAPGSRIVSVQVYEAVFRLLRERWPGAQVDVFSEGRDGWREPRWAAALGSARLHVDDDDDDDDKGDHDGGATAMLRAHRAMVEADVLVTAKSTFSYSAALLSRGEVWALPFCGSASFCFPPLSSWHVVCEVTAPPWCNSPGDVLKASSLGHDGLEAVRAAANPRPTT